MEKISVSSNPSVGVEEQSKEHEDLLSTLPRVTLWDGFDLYQYQGFWVPNLFLHGLILSQKHFQAQDTDILLCSYPKGGTTWLKALAFSILNRPLYGLENSPLLTTSPHQLVPYLDLDLYNPQNQSSVLEDLTTPRVFATHASFTSLPNSIVNSNCRIVYICRNPLDQFISEWHFMYGIQDMEPCQIEEAFERVCNGVQCFGPFWEHVLGYWEANLEQPHRLLFLKYEDLKEDINFYIKKLADFLGCPFTDEEENKGVIKEISKLCSFDNIKDLEVNKIGKRPTGVRNCLHFRKGKVGDWKNYLTPSMSQRLEKLIEEKLGYSGLIFTI